MDDHYGYPSDEPDSGPDDPPYRLEEGLALDAVFELLSDRRRRYALYCLNGSPSGVVEFSELVQCVTAKETEGGECSTDHCRSLATELLYHHLPKLIEANVVEYDSRSDTVRYRERPSLQEWLEHAEYKECE